MFDLKPQSIYERVKASGQLARIPRLGGSLLRGAIGFTAVSLGGFAPWILCGPWFYRNTGEAGLYATCAIVFMGLSGLFLSRLIIGPGSLVRFYKIFSLAFLAYAIAWTIGWMLLRGVAGSVTGLLAGAVVMAAILASGFGAYGSSLKIAAAIFIGNAAGYFVGQWVAGKLFATSFGAGHGLGFDKSLNATLAKIAWAVFYGLGFGAAIGFAFHVGQTEARKLIQTDGAGTN